MVKAKVRKKKVECKSCSEAAGGHGAVFHDSPACEPVGLPPQVELTEAQKVGAIRATTYEQVAAGDCPICGCQMRKLRFINNPYGDDYLGCLGCGEQHDASNEVPFDV